MILDEFLSVLFLTIDSCIILVFDFKFVQQIEYFMKFLNIFLNKTLPIPLKTKLVLSIMHCYYHKHKHTVVLVKLLVTKEKPLFVQM